MSDYTPLFEAYLDGSKKSSGDWSQAYCPFHEVGGKEAGHKTPSFAFNSVSGGWKCFGCHKLGNAIDFAGLTTSNGYDPAQSAAKLEASKKVKTHLPWFEVRIAGANSSSGSTRTSAKTLLPTTAEVQTAHDKLMLDPEALEYLKEQRSWSEKTLVDHSIGLSPDRRHFFIPIYVQGELVNVRMYSPKGKTPWDATASKIRGIKGCNEVRIYPDSVLENESDKVFLVEGEGDALAMLSAGVQAVTFTGGAGNTPSDLHRLREKEITILYDNDEAGVRGAKKVALALRKYTQMIKVIQLEELFPDLGDITEAFVDFGNIEVARKLNALEKNTEFQATNVVRNTAVRETGFDEAINSNQIGARISLSAMVMGARERPYAACSRIAADCDNAGTKPYCSLCPLSSGHGYYPNDADDRLSERELLRQVRKSEVYVAKQLRTLCGFLCDDFEINQANSTIESVYELVIGPYHDGQTEESMGFQQRTVFATNSGKPFRINQPYQFEGVTIPQPWDQANTHVFTKFEEVERAVDEFAATEEDKRRFSIFQVGPSP